MKKVYNPKKSGFADTKTYPHKGHPANYRHISRDKVEYLTFTHTNDKVKIRNKEYNVIPLTSNVDPKEREQIHNLSYVFPRKFVGRRSALGKERKDLSFTKDDQKIIDDLYKKLPTVYVTYSKKHKKRQ